MSIAKGDTVWIGHYGDSVHKVLVLSDPDELSQVAVMDLGFDPDAIQLNRLYLGDLGYPGYAYDDRPCMVAKDELSAAMAGKEWGNWWRMNAYRFQMDLDHMEISDSDYNI